MTEESPVEEKRKVVRTVERLLNAKDELDFLLELSTTDLQRLIVAIRGRLEK